MRQYQRDHDRSLLFPISEDPSLTYHRYSPPMRPKVQSNLYVNRDLRLVEMSARDKCVMDKQSNIFYEPTKLEKSPPPIQKQEQLQELNHRQRMIFQNASKVLPGYDYNQAKQICSSRTKIIENPNESLKHQNQNFSDLFGRQCGDQKNNVRVRSASPQLDWTAHDSVRNARDCTSNEYTTKQIGQSPLKPTEMTNLVINCRQQSKGLNSYAKLHGKQSQTLKPEYYGMLKWKNNYK